MELHPDVVAQAVRVAEALRRHAYYMATHGDRRIDAEDQMDGEDFAAFCARRSHVDAEFLWAQTGVQRELADYVRACAQHGTPEVSEMPAVPAATLEPEKRVGWFGRLFGR